MGKKEVEESLEFYYVLCVCVKFYVIGWYSHAGIGFVTDFSREHVLCICF